jgi:hypothetical protein
LAPANKFYLSLILYSTFEHSTVSSKAFISSYTKSLIDLIEHYSSSSILYDLCPSGSYREAKEGFGVAGS